MRLFLLAAACALAACQGQGELKKKMRDDACAKNLDCAYGLECVPAAAVDGGPVAAIFIRAPVVDRAGDGVEVLAVVDGAPVLCRQGPIVVAAFHPELSDDRRIHQLFLEGS